MANRKIVRCSHDKKNEIALGSPTLAAARIALKIYQGWPPRTCSQCSRFHRNRFTFRLIPELLEHRQSALQSEAKIRLEPSFAGFVPNNNNYYYTGRSSKIVLLAVHYIHAATK